MRNKIKITIGIIFIIILVSILILFAPIKNVVKHVDTINVEKEKLLLR